MEKNEGKIKLIIIFVNIFISVGLIYLGYKDYKNYLNSIKNEKQVSNNFNEIIKENKDLKEDISLKEEELNKLNDINKLITDEQNEVFKLANEVEHKIQNKESNKKIVYLTFDDGPYYNTYKVLKILKDNQVKATFFTTNVNGNNCYDNYSYNCHLLYKEIANNHHTIANHTYTHSIYRGLYSSSNSFIDSVLKQENLIKDYTGITTNIVRFPGGSVTAGKLKNSIIEELRKHNYGWVDWTAEDGDGRSLSSTNEAWSYLKQLINEDIEVVLLHDYHPITTQILPDFIKYLENNGYIILPLFYDSVMINK